jgi:branched-chain amino acid transport system ATP-binding protein
MALSMAQYGYILELGRVAYEGPAAELADNEEVKRFYLGINEAETKRDFARFKDKNVRLAEGEQRRMLI